MTTPQVPPMDRKAFGKRMRELRSRRGWTQEQMAEYTSLSSDTIRRLEHGKFNPSLDTMGKIAAGLELPLPSLLEDQLDEADELAVFIRHLPRPQRSMALALIYALHHHLLELV